MSFYGINLTQLSDQYSGDPRNGRQILRRLHGTPTQILAQANAAKNLGLRYEVRELYQGGHQEITIYIGGTEEVDKNTPLADVWTLRANEIEKNLWDTQVVFNQLAPLSAGNVAKLRWGVEQVLNGTIDDITHLTIPAGVNPVVIQGLISAMAMGVESKPMSLSVIQRKMVIPPNSDIRPNFVGVDQVIASGNLAAGKDPSTSGPVPQNILFSMQDGWYLKKMPTVEQSSATTWEITQEWWNIGEWYHTFVFTEYGA